MHPSWLTYIPNCLVAKDTGKFVKFLRIQRNNGVSRQQQITQKTALSSTQLELVQTQPADYREVPEPKKMMGMSVNMHELTRCAAIRAMLLPAQM